MDFQAFISDLDAQIRANDGAPTLTFQNDNYALWSGPATSAKYPSDVLATVSNADRYVTATFGASGQMIAPLDGSYPISEVGVNDLYEKFKRIYGFRSVL